MPRIAGIDKSGYAIGQIVKFGMNTLPFGTLLLDGSAVSQTTYAGLFAKIGTTWNTGGEGAGNFRLPDARRKAPVGSGGTGTGTLGNAVGNTGGAETHTLSSGELAAHPHPITDPGHFHPFIQDLQHAVAIAGPGNVFAPNSGNTPTTSDDSTVGSKITGITTTNNNTSAGGAHNNIQPSLVVKFAIAYI